MAKCKPVELEWHSVNILFCGRCMKAIEADWSYCPHCGAKIKRKKPGRTANTRDRPPVPYMYC